MSALVFFLMIRRPPRSTLDRSSAASDVYKRQVPVAQPVGRQLRSALRTETVVPIVRVAGEEAVVLSLINISEPTRPY